MKQTETKNNDLAGQIPQLKETKVKPELSQEAIEERLLLSGLLIQRTEELVEEAQKRKKQREEEVIELRSGEKISLAEINNHVTAHRQPYEPKFPNDVPFYKELYRLNGWTIDGLDPNSFTKPAIVGKWTRQIIYGRFSKDVLPALDTLNPTLPNGLRMHKLFQYLTLEGQQKLIQFRDEAIEVMKTCSTYYEFRQKLFKEYGVPYQLDAFEHNDE